MSKKKNKRSQIKNPALIKQYNSKIRQEYIDIDYIDKLDDTKKNCKLPNGTKVTEREYMNLFMAEWNNAEVGKQSKAKGNNFQRTAELVKDATDRNNKRNSDVQGRARATNTLYFLEEAAIDQNMNNSRELSNGINQVEDAMIELLDKPKDTGDTSDDTDN